MPRPYSEDLRWHAIWMKKNLGYQVDEVAAALMMSSRTIKRYVSRVLNFGEVKANTIGRPLNSVAMHPHMEFWDTFEFLIMEGVLEHPEKTLPEIEHDVYTETGSDFALASIFYYLERNPCSLKKVCLHFSPLESIFRSYLT